MPWRLHNVLHIIRKNTKSVLFKFYNVIKRDQFYLRRSRLIRSIIIQTYSPNVSRPDKESWAVTLCHKLKEAIMCRLIFFFLSIK